MRRTYIDRWREVLDNQKKSLKLLRLLLVKIHANQCIEFRGLDWIEFSSQQIQFARFPEIVEY
jgi:hypothetical protein